ncbi:MAG: replicative DNA helicase [Lachnospiraceae bacterium]|nr:replicative DNA helicase [Lachnospiraceae bacterium]MDD7224440.1 replicative DNA helicase [Lachnospiraceae bacterium]MDO4509049.1 replicative DNA helicase [Lachnospiraceae bacterium]MDY3255308.1 replicative DNA helicase [Lachnospiraceae bacterium]MDY4427495.1 replicative DNA helicase [Lachnospiraceae bacterium]
MADEEVLIKRIMPHNFETEKSVIGSMLTSKDAIVEAAGILSPDDFYGKQYGILFKAIVELDTLGKDVDLITIKEHLSTMQGVPDGLNALEFVKEILDTSYTASYVKQYCEYVKGKSILRKLINFNEDVSKMCYEGKDPVDVILEDTEKKIFDIVQNRNTADYVPINEVVINTVQNIRAVSKAKGTVTGIPSGFIELDRMTAGFHGSELILIAARPAMGKTAFVLNVADYVCFNQQKSAAVFSLEMSKEQLVQRLLAQEAKIDAQHIRTGSLDDKEWMALMEGANTIANSKLIIDDTPNISISELRSKCRKYKHDLGIDIIIIDYLQLMSGGGKIESRQQEISEISRSLKGLARELDVPVIALSQLSRAVEKREEHRPVLSDLRESGAIEQDADVVMFLYRDDYYHPDTEKRDVAEVIIAKQRSGPIGTVELAWLREFTKFANLAK